MMTSSMKCVVIVARKKLSLSILQTAGIVLSQIAHVGTQLNVSMKVRKMSQIVHMTRSTTIGNRIAENLNSLQ